MPQLTIRGIEKDILAKGTHQLVPKLAVAMQADEEDFTVDALSVESYYKGKSIATFPFIQVGWFDRGQDVQDACAKLIDEEFKALGVDALEIVFVAFERRCYYADGQH